MSIIGFELDRLIQGYDIQDAPRDEKVVSSSICRLDFVMSLVAKYYDEFLAGKLNQSLLEDAHKLSSRFAITIRESPQWRRSLEVKLGILTSISSENVAVDCEFMVDTEETFFGIVAGRMSPQWAFFQRKIEIVGNLEVGLKTVSVLAKFFQKYPFATVAD